MYTFLKKSQYYEYPVFKASVATVQIKMTHQKAMHKVVLNLEYILARVQHAQSKLLYRKPTFIKLSQFLVEHIILVL